MQIRARYLAMIVTGLMSAFISSKICCQRTASQIHELSPTAARLNLAVHLEGHVTGLSGWKNSFFLDDGSSGISINRLPDQGPVLRPGDYVIVDGKTDAGLFAPLVTDTSVRLVRHDSLRAAPLASPSDLAWGEQDSQFRSVIGVVHQTERKFVWNRSIVVLTLDIGGGTAPLAVHVVDADQDPSSSAFDWQSLVGARVKISGVCGTIWNDRRQFAGLRLFTESITNIEILKAALAPTQQEVKPIGHILQYHPTRDGAEEVATSGVVSALERNAGFYIQDASSGIFVHDKHDSVRVGQRLEVLGFPSIGSTGPVVTATSVKVLGEASLQPAFLDHAEAIITAKDGFVTSPYDSLLISLTGYLLDTTDDPQKTTLLLRNGGIVFRAVISRQGSGSSFERGSVIQVTGVCDVSLDDSGSPEMFSVRLRSREDVELVRRAPWWTLRRSAFAGGSLLLVCAAMVSWILYSKKRGRLRDLALTDQLTGVYNRRAFLLLGEKQLEMLRRKNSSLTLFFLDLDRFKEINDLHGHRSGDAALRTFAMILRQVFRESDILCRLGGDEFAVFASETTAGFGDALKERLYAATQAENKRSSHAFTLQVSVGAVYVNAEHLREPLEVLLEEADAVMYRHKRMAVTALGTATRAPNETQIASRPHEWREVDALQGLSIGDPCSGSGSATVGENALAALNYPVVALSSDRGKVIDSFDGLLLREPACRPANPKRLVRGFVQGKT